MDRRNRGQTRLSAHLKRAQAARERRSRIFSLRLLPDSLPLAMLAFAAHRSARNDIPISKIRLVCRRHVIVEDVRHVVLSADLFDRLLLHAPIAPHGGPGAIERAW